MLDLARALVATLLLCGSCSIMVCAWYLHLNYSGRWSTGKAIIISWLIAGGEYILQVPANRMGAEAGLSAAHLRAIAEVAILTAFIAFQTRVLCQPLLWNHVIGFVIMLIAVLIVLFGPFSSPVGGSEHAPVATAVPIGKPELEMVKLVNTERSPPASPPPLSPAWLRPQQPRRLPLPPLPSPPPPTSAAPVPPSPIPLPAPCSPPRPATPRAPSSTEMTIRLNELLDHSSSPRQQALRELAAGHKRGHWIWWAFPTLPLRGGDMNSLWTGADLQSIAEARAYAAHPALRAALLRVLRTAAAAFGARDDRLGPYRVLDAGFGRRAQGVWINGPVDSFKAWCSCTLFRELATASGDAELGAAARAVLRTFEGGAIVYTAGGEGTAGYTEDVSARRNVLDSAGDTQTLRLLESIDTSE